MGVSEERVAEGEKNRGYKKHNRKENAAPVNCFSIYQFTWQYLIPHKEKCS